MRRDDYIDNIEEDLTDLVGDPFTPKPITLMECLQIFVICFAAVFLVVCDKQVVTSLSSSITKQSPHATRGVATPDVTDNGLPQIWFRQDCPPYAGMAFLYQQNAATCPCPARP